VTSRSDAYQLERTGRSEYAELEDRIQRALERVRARTTELGTMPYTPSTPANWTSPAPTTVAEALDRLAVGGGPPF
jgi:hypothetical protein